MSDELDELVIDLPDLEAIPGTAPAPRFPVDLRVVWDNGDHCSSGPAINLSMSGMFIKTRDPPPVGKDVRLMPMINGENSNVVIKGIVVRADEHRQKGMGVKFTPQTRQERLVLERFVEAYAARAPNKGKT